MKGAKKSLNTVEQERKGGKEMPTFGRVHVPAHIYLSQDILFRRQWLTKPWQIIDADVLHSPSKGQ